MACEALQHGVAEVVAVERDRRIAAVARTNREAVRGGLAGVGESDHPTVRVDVEEVQRWLGRAKGPGFDLIYLDPPYRAGLYDPVGEQVAERGLLAPGGLMVWECARDAVPEPGDRWQVSDRRNYGSTTLLLLESAERGSNPEPKAEG
jgi:16S rRNA G966 N2-methylase RsmD